MRTMSKTEDDGKNKDEVKYDVEEETALFMQRRLRREHSGLESPEGR